MNTPGRTFALEGASITFAPLEAERCALMYGRALDFSRDVDRHLKEKRGDGYDLEISIDETTAPTLPAHHLFIAAELARRGVAVNSLAPRFVGEFQKGIDYIGDTAEFERQFKVHCAIARRYGGYKVSIHSGSDKFSVYPAIGRHTGMRLHLKTAGTSWLEAVRVTARTDPALFREMLGKAFASFEEATRLYHVTTNLGAIPDARTCADSDLERYLDAKDSRQLLHITYGGLLNDPQIRERFFQTLARNEEAHYAAVEKHMDKHLRLLGVPMRAGLTTVPCLCHCAHGGDLHDRIACAGNSPCATICPASAPSVYSPAEVHMILVREIFQIKFGRMKEAKDIWKQMVKIMPTENKPRVLTDLTGPYYTLVMESTYKNLSNYEAEMQREMSGSDFGALYQKFIPLVDSGRREIFTIVDGI